MTSKLAEPESLSERNSPGQLSTTASLLNPCVDRSVKLPSRDLSSGRVISIGEGKQWESAQKLLSVSSPWPWRDLSSGRASYRNSIREGKQWESEQKLPSLSSLSTQDLDRSDLLTRVLEEGQQEGDLLTRLLEEGQQWESPLDAQQSVSLLEAQEAVSELWTNCSRALSLFRRSVTESIQKWYPNTNSRLAKSFNPSTSQSYRADLRPAPTKIVESEIKEADSLPSDPLPRPSEMNKFYLFLFFWHAYSPVMYSLYKVDVQIPPPPPSAVQDSRKKLSPILKLKTGEYADGMCCVQLGSVLCFMGGEMNIDNPYIDKDVKKELHVKKELPKDVYCFELAIDHNYAGELEAGPPMNSGKARPLAFVANEKIYVIGSFNQDLDENFAYFEMYDPYVNSWRILPNPPIKNVNTIWARHVVVGRKALMVAWQQEKERLYCFDLDTHEWANTSIPDYPGNFSGNTEFVGNTLYGCYFNTIAAIAPSKEEEEEAEEKELQQLFKHHCLHQVSKEMGMDAILKVPPQVQYSSRLLHLREKCFCYVRTGMPPHPDPDLASDLVIGDDKKRFISIVIFDAVGETYKKDNTRFFKAKFLHSEHYEVNTSFPNEGFIKGCYVLGPGYLESSEQISV